MGRNAADTVLAIGPYRVQLRLTKANLVSLTGLSRATVSKIEAGRPTDRVTMLKVIDALVCEARRFGQLKMLNELQDISLRLSSALPQATTFPPYSLDTRFGISHTLVSIENQLMDFAYSGKLALCSNEEVESFYDRMVALLENIRMGLKNRKLDPGTDR